MAEIQVKVPDIGDFKDVAIIEVLVKPGDTVAVEQSLITVESDKASMEIPSTHAGKVKSLAVKLGDTVNEGSVILVLEAEGAASESKPAPAPAQKGPAATQSAAPATPAGRGDGLRLGPQRHGREGEQAGAGADVGDVGEALAARL